MSPIRRPPTVPRMRPSASSRAHFALRRPKGLLERVAEQRRPRLRQLPAAAGGRRPRGRPSPRQLLYKAGRYMIRLRLEPAADAERLSIVGQLVDEQRPARQLLQDIAVLALEGWEDAGPDADEPPRGVRAGARRRPRTSGSRVGVAEIGTFTVAAAPGDGKVRRRRRSGRSTRRVVVEGRGSSSAAETLRQRETMKSRWIVGWSILLAVFVVSSHAGGLAAEGDKIVRTKSLTGLPVVSTVCALLGCEVLGALDVAARIDRSRARSSWCAACSTTR